MPATERRRHRPAGSPPLRRGRSHDRATAAVGVLALGGTAAVAATGLGAGLPALVAGRSPGADDVALLTAGVLALGLLVRWLVGALLLAGSAAVAATGRRWAAGEEASQRALPRGVHALLVTGLGAGALGAGPAAHAAAATPVAVASAPVASPLVAAGAPAGGGPTRPDTGGPDTGTPGNPGRGAPSVTGGLDPGWTPTQPADPPCPDPGPTALGTPTRTAADVPDVVVHRGDTLWSVAARVLPVDATDAEIAVEWPRWYRANRAAIGPDPDRLLPGVRLQAPLP